MILPHALAFFKIHSKLTVQTHARTWYLPICLHQRIHTLVASMTAIKHSRFDTTAQSDSSLASLSSEDSSLDSFSTILASMYNLAAVQKKVLCQQSLSNVPKTMYFTLTSIFLYCSPIAEILSPQLRNVIPLDQSRAALPLR